MIGDFLDNLVLRTLSPAAGMRPKTPSIFEPPSHAAPIQPATPIESSDIRDAVESPATEKPRPNDPPVPPFRSAVPQGSSNRSSAESSDIPEPRTARGTVPAAPLVSVLGSRMEPVESQTAPSAAPTLIDEADAFQVKPSHSRGTTRHPPASPGEAQNSEPSNATQEPVAPRPIPADHLPSPQRIAIAPNLPDGADAKARPLADSVNVQPLRQVGSGVLRGPADLEPAHDVRQKQAPVAPALPRFSSSKSNSEPTSIHVTIGRVEVRAALPAPRPRAPTAVGAKSSLDQYLARRVSGGRS